MVESDRRNGESGDVTFVGWQKVDAGLVTAIVRGDVASVKPQLTPARRRPSRGRADRVHVIARPADDLEKIFHRLDFFCGGEAWSACATSFFQRLSCRRRAHGWAGCA